MANAVPSLQNLARMSVINLIILGEIDSNISEEVYWDDIPRQCPIAELVKKLQKLLSAKLGKENQLSLNDFVDLHILNHNSENSINHQEDFFIKKYKRAILEILFSNLFENKVQDFTVWANFFECNDLTQLSILAILTRAKTQNFNDWNTIFLRWNEIIESLETLYDKQFFTSDNQTVYNYLEISNQKLLFNGKSVLANPTFTLMLLEAHGCSTFHNPDFPLHPYLVLLKYIIEIVAKSNHEALDLAEYFRNIETREPDVQKRHVMQQIIVGTTNNRPQNLLKFIIENNLRTLLPEILHILASHPNPKKLAQAFIYLHENGVSNIEIWKKDPVLVVERYLEYLNKNRRINRLFILLEIALGLLSLIFIVAFATCKLPLLIMLIPPSFALTLVTCMFHWFLSETKDLTSYATNTQRYDESTTIQATTITHSV